MTNNTPKDLAQDTGKEFPALVASMPASTQQRRIAFGVILLLSVVFALVMPYARIQAGRLDAFIPVVQTVLCFADVITAIFLFAQYSIQPQRALLVLASGYIFSGVFAFLQTLDFPGAYSATGLLSNGPSGAAWFFSFWHIAFPLAVIAYVLLRDTDETARLPFAFDPGRTIAATIACVLVAIAGITWITAAGHLPSMFDDQIRQTPFAQHLSGAMWLISAIALVLLIFRMRTILELWLIVALFASLPDLALSFLYPVVRYSIGWYTARSYALIASCTVLIVLLVETTMLYTRLARATILQRRERADRLMSVDAATGAIAHEIAQPLAAISINCSAALRWLNKTPADIEEVRARITATSDNSHRAVEIISSIRGMFKTTTANNRTMIDLNGVARQAVGMLEHELREHGVSVSTEFQENLPHIMADSTQIQQVILNLIKNAVDAMEIGPSDVKTLGLTTGQNGNSVVFLSVKDSGPGIDPGDKARIFDPFFTTKSSGMGLGLSICRKIVEEHGGELRLTKTDSIGCTFEITLPRVAPIDGL